MTEKVMEIQMDKLVGFRNHPFQVKDDEALNVKPFAHFIVSKLSTHIIPFSSEIVNAISTEISYC